MDNKTFDVFLSYRFGDLNDSDIETIKNKIAEKCTLNVFWIKEDMFHGDFDNELQKRVAEAYAFMPVVTDNYLAFGEEGGREKRTDRCLMEYKTAINPDSVIKDSDVVIMPVRVTCQSAGTETISRERIADAATGEETPENLAVLKSYLLKQQGVAVDPPEKTGKSLCDSLCDKVDAIIRQVYLSMFDSEACLFYKNFLNRTSERLMPMYGGDLYSGNMRLDNSYIELRFQKGKTEEEKRKEDEDSNNRKNRRAQDREKERINNFISEDDIKINLERERFAVVVGDAGQGKSTFAKKLFVDYAGDINEKKFDKNSFFPLYLECNNLLRIISKAKKNKDSIKNKSFFYWAIANELERNDNASAFMVEPVIKRGKPLFIFDGLDEGNPDDVDDLIFAVFTHLILPEDCADPCILFTSRPGQRLLFGGSELTIGNTYVVRRYTIDLFDNTQRDEYLNKLEKALNKKENYKEKFRTSLIEKEKNSPDYLKISRNPFILFALFSSSGGDEGWQNGNKKIELPRTKFEAFDQMIEWIITRDLRKASEINEEFKKRKWRRRIKIILGYLAFQRNQSRDSRGQGDIDDRKGDAPVDAVEELNKKIKDKIDPDDVEQFFDTSRLYDKNGFGHEFLSSSYAAYYLFWEFENDNKKQKTAKDFINKYRLNGEAEYRKSTCEAFLCLLDKETDVEEDEESSINIVAQVATMLEECPPDFGLLCGAVSQFDEDKNNQKAIASIIAEKILNRGCHWVENRLSGIYSAESSSKNTANPYKELFYYTAVYPCLKKGSLFDRPNGIPEAETTREYIINELIKELRAAYSNSSYCDLKRIYLEREEKTERRAVDRILKKASAVVSLNSRGFKRLKEGITTIKEQAFLRNNELTFIFIPDSVTEIGEASFNGCTGLKSIDIPNSVTEIGRSAFSGCTGLISITIPDSVTKIGIGAFSGCTGLTCIKIPRGVTEIGRSAFSGCTGLTRIEIPNSVTKIGRKSFEGCSGLTIIEFPDSLREIENEAFAGCSSLTTLTVDKNNTSFLSNNDDNCIIERGSRVLILGCKNSTIPDDVAEIGQSAFEGCSGLASIDIPDSVTRIGRYAFKGCTGLTCIDIPDSVTEICTDAFSGCSRLTRVTIPDSRMIGLNPFSNCSNIEELKTRHDFLSWNENNCIISGYLAYLTLEIGCKKSKIPDGVSRIGYDAFNGCTGLTGITIPNSVTEICSGAFEGCTGLKSIEIPDGVTEIDSDIFNGCTGLTSIEIPDNVTEIGNNAFEGCTGLKYIKISDILTKIDYLAFKGCTKLTDIIFPGSVSTIKWGAFKNCTSLASVEIPYGVTKIEHGTFSGCAGLTSIKIPDSVTEIEKDAFSECTGLTDINIPYGIKRISERTFFSCTGLTGIEIPDSVTEIGEGAFSRCTGLTDIDIPKSVKIISEFAFSGCTALKDIDIPNSVAEIGKGAFARCTGLESIRISTKVTKISNSAFYGCSGLTTVIIPYSVASIEPGAFSGCSKLTSIRIPTTVQEIKAGAFEDCSSLSEIAIPNGVKKIANRLFGGCSRLTQIDIPDSVTEICSSAFYSCTAITEIKIPDSVTEIGTGAFSGCTGLKSITMPQYLTELNAGVLFGCSALEKITIPKATKRICEEVFSGCTSLAIIQYEGSQEEWERIALDEWGNDMVKKARIVFNYEGN